VGVEADVVFVEVVFCAAGLVEGGAALAAARHLRGEMEEVVGTASHIACRTKDVTKFVFAGLFFLMQDADDVQAPERLAAAAKRSGWVRASLKAP
jgi:hypothetical protein